MPREAPERPFSGVFSLGQWFSWARVAACPRAAFLRLFGLCGLSTGPAGYADQLIYTPLAHIL
ncbi:MAG: hypothetical protein ABTQ25_06300 [Nitrosomonas ureae]